MDFFFSSVCFFYFLPLTSSGRLSYAGYSLYASRHTMTAAHCLKKILVIAMLFGGFFLSVPVHAQTPPQTTFSPHTATRSGTSLTTEDSLIKTPHGVLTQAPTPLSITITVKSSLGGNITGEIVVKNSEKRTYGELYGIFLLTASETMSLPSLSPQNFRLLQEKLERNDFTELLISYNKTKAFQLKSFEEKTIPFSVAYPQTIKQGTYQLQVIIEGKERGSITNQTIDVGLYGNNRLLYVDESTCKVVVPDGGTYPALIAPLVNPHDQPKAVCDIVNTTKEATTASAMFTYAQRHVATYLFSEKMQGKDPQHITLQPGEKKTVSVLLPKVAKPQVYEALVSFVNPQGEQISQILPFRWTIKGTSAFIAEVALEKGYYGSGETAKTTVTFAPSMDLFWQRYFPNEGTPLQEVTLKLTFTNPQGVFCGEKEQTVKPINNGESFTTAVLDVPMNNDCQDPHIKADVIHNGTVLATYTRAFLSRDDELPKADPTITLLIGMALLIAFILIVGIFLFKRWKKERAFHIFIGLGFLLGLSLLQHLVLTFPVLAAQAGGRTYTNLREPTGPATGYVQYHTWDPGDTDPNLQHPVPIEFFTAGSRIERISANKVKVTINTKTLQSPCDNPHLGYFLRFWFYVNGKPAKDLGMQFQYWFMHETPEWKDAGMPIEGTGMLTASDGSFQWEHGWEFYYPSMGVSQRTGNTNTMTFYLKNVPTDMNQFDMYFDVLTRDRDWACDAYQSSGCASNDSYSSEWEEVGHVGVTFYDRIGGRVVDSCGNPLGGIPIDIYDDSLPVDPSQKTKTVTSNTQGWWAIEDHVRVYDAYAVRPRVPAGYDSTASPASYENQQAGFTSAVSNCDENCHFTFNVTGPTQSNLRNSCNAAGTQSTMSWNNTGADFYQIRVNNTSNDWNGSCDTPNAGDTCDNNVTTTSKTITTTPGQNYDWWVHAIKQTQAGAVCGSAAIGSSFLCTAPPPTAQLSCTVNWTTYERTPRVETTNTAKLTYAVQNGTGQYISVYRCDTNGNNCTRLANLTCSGNDCSVPVAALATANQQYKLKFMINDREGYGVGTNSTDSIFCDGEAAYTTVAAPTCSATYSFAPADAGVTSIIAGANVKATVSSITCQNVNCNYIALYDEKGHRLALVDNGNNTYSATFPAGEYGSHSVKLYVMDNTAYSQLSTPADRTQCGTGTYNAVYGNIYGAVYVDYNGNGIRDWDDADGNGIRNLQDSNKDGIIGGDGDYYERYTEPLTSNFNFFIEDNRTPKGRYNPSADDPYVIDLNTPRGGLIAESFDPESNVAVEYRSPKIGGVGSFRAFGKADDRRYTINILPKTETAPQTSSGSTSTNQKTWLSPLSDIVRQLLGHNYELPGTTTPRTGTSIDIKYPNDTFYFGLVPGPRPIGLVVDRDTDTGAIRGSLFGTSGLRASQQGSNYYNTLEVILEADRGPDVGRSEDRGRSITIVGKAFAADTTTLNSLQERTIPAENPNTPTNAPVLTQLTQSARAAGGFVIVYVNAQTLTEKPNATSIRLRATDNSWNQRFEKGRSYIYYKKNNGWGWNEIPALGRYWYPSSEANCDPNTTPSNSLCEISVIRDTTPDSAYSKTKKEPIEYITYDVTLFNKMGNKTWGTFEYLLDKSGREATTENGVCNLLGTCKYRPTTF